MDGAKAASKKKKNKNKNRKKKASSIPISGENICTLCNENNVEISMCCSKMHSYCFTCIKNWADEKDQVICPECRKTCSNIAVIPSENESKSEILKDFLDSIIIIPYHTEKMCCDCCKNELENSAILPYWTIYHYIDNIDQIKLYNKNKDIPNIKSLINWNLHEE